MDSPRAILLITGSELTRGETRDLNGPYLATELSSMGMPVEEIALVPDDPALLAAALRRATERAELVVLSGGLGPTADDHTVKVVAEVFGGAVTRHPPSVERMRERARQRGYTDDRIPENFWKQSEVVEGAEPLLNPVGLAPGMLLATARGLLAVLPGVPREMQAMFREGVAPRVLERLRLAPPRILRVKVMGLGESWAEAPVQALGIDIGRIEYGISAKPGELLLKFIAHRPEDHASLDEVREKLLREFGDDLVLLPEGLRDASGAAMETVHAALVMEMLLARKATVATAESCTGGLIAKLLTDRGGASASFLGSVVAYGNHAKVDLLGVPQELLDRHGAVSAEVCRAMAEGARRRFGADLALSVTGVAGPGGATPEKPVGLVWIGLAVAERPGRPEKVEVERRDFWGSRENIRSLAATRGLDMLRRELARMPPPAG